MYNRTCNTMWPFNQPTPAAPFRQSSCKLHRPGATERSQAMFIPQNTTSGKQEGTMRALLEVANSSKPATSNLNSTSMRQCRFRLHEICADSKFHARTHAPHPAGSVQEGHDPVLDDLAVPVPVLAVLQRARMLVPQVPVHCAGTRHTCRSQDVPPLQPQERKSACTLCNTAHPPTCLTDQNPAGDADNTVHDCSGDLTGDILKP